MNSGPTISVGASGNDVRRLQRLLVEMKLLDFMGIDGIFGPNTDASVRSFQESAGLAVDGIVGPLTWGALPADPNTPQLSQGDTGGQSGTDRRHLRADDGRRGARVSG
jgi:peptidoglycan hydrolase-like protein with peptidoglycan-binding domain